MVGRTGQRVFPDDILRFLGASSLPIGYGRGEVRGE
jgi:hypothetical protein